MSDKLSRQVFQMYQMPAQITALMELEDDAQADALLAEIAHNLEATAPEIINGMMCLADHAEMLKVRAAAFTDAARKLEATEKRIKETIKTAMVESGMMKIGGFTVSAAAPAVEVAEGAEPPAQFCDVIPASLKLRTADIKAALKSGEEFEGYSLRPVFTLRVKL